MKTVSYNIIDAAESDYLYIEPSQISNAGNGLFTAIPIYKDEMIATFKGEILTQTSAEKRASVGQDRYFINLPNGKILDSMHMDCFAKFANDATHSDRNLRNNCKIALDDDGRVGIIAVRRIKAGEELFCSYGQRYWKKHLK